MRKFTFKSLLIAAALCLGTSAWADTGSATVKMTYVDYNNATTAMGEISEGRTARSGYNKISGGSVGFANTGWNCNWITYIQVDASGINGTITGATLTADISGSTDNKRTTTWGVGYNSSVWSADMTYDSADKTITTLGGTQSSSSKSSTTFTTKTFDITAALVNDDDKIVTLLVYETAAAGGYIKNPTVSVEYKAAGAKVANYKVKFVCNGNEIKTAITSSGFVGDACTIDSELLADFMSDDGNMKYIYVSDDSSDKTITEDGSTVVTVTYREAATYSYTIKSNLGSTIAFGSNFEGETITYGYPQYQVSDGTLYSTSKNGNEWRKTFELTEDNQEVTVNYDATSITDVVFHIENENIEGVNVLTANNANIRCSNAAAAWSSSDVVLTTLDKGTYKLVAQVFSPQSSGGNQTFKVGGVTINFITGNSNTTVCESEFMVTDNKDLVWSAGGGNRNGIDFVYVVKLSDELSPVTTAITAAGYATFSSTYAVDFSKAAGLAAYTAKVNDGNQTITLTKIADGIVPANTGVVLKGAAGEYTGTITTTEAVIENNDLVAATEEIASLATETTVDEVKYKNYILNVVDETPGFYQAAGKKVAAGKAYLQVPAETVTGAKTLTIVWNDGETTGIEENYEFGTMNSDAATFDLSGRKVANPAKGLYIKNGKKFIVK